MKRKYNKLVRDRIPEIIERSGKRAVWRTLSEDEYLSLLDRKLDEELLEYRDGHDPEELADLLEVLYAEAVARGFDLSEIERIRLRKKAERGAFEKRLLLESVED